MMKRKSFWVVYLTAEQNIAHKNYLTVVSDKKSAIEYIQRKLVMDHLDHFKQWVNLHGFSSIDSQQAFELYIKTVLEPEDLAVYSLGKIMYTDDELSSILRITMGCDPVGCSYETPAEIQLALFKLPEDKIAEIKSEVKKQFEILKKDQGIN